MNISKKLLLVVGISVGILSPIINLLFLNKNSDASARGLILFSIIHLSFIINVFFINIDQKPNFVKIMALIAFLIYPLLPTADYTNLFGDSTFGIVIISTLVYMAGYTALVKS